MKLTKTLLFSALLFLVPTAALADLCLLGILLCGGGTPPPAPVPEPSGALLMGVALTVAGLVSRRRK